MGGLRRGRVGLGTGLARHRVDERLLRRLEATDLGLEDRVQPGELCATVDDRVVGDTFSPSARS